MTSSTNLLSLPEDMLLKISTTISISDILKLIKTNKLLNQLMMKEKAIKYYCFHNNILSILPRANVTPIEIWQGLHYFTEAEKIGEKISATNMSLNAMLQNNESIYDSLLIQNVNVTLTETQAQQVEKIKLFQNQIESLQQSYNILIDKAVEKKNIVALIYVIRNTIKLLRADDIQDYMSKFAAEESKLKSLEAMYGVIVNFFLARLYIDSARCLLFTNKTIEPLFKTRPNQVLELFDVEIRRKLGMPIFPADSLEEIEKVYNNEIQNLLDKARDNLSIFVKEIKSLDHHAVLSALKMCDMNNGGITLETFISELSDEIEEINKNNTLNIPIGRKPS